MITEILVSDEGFVVAVVVCNVIKLFVQVRKSKYRQVQMMSVTPVILLFDNEAERLTKCICLLQNKNKAFTIVC